MQIAAGGYINMTNVDDMYGISQRDFEDTYKFTNDLEKKVLVYKYHFFISLVKMLFNHLLYTFLSPSYSIQQEKNYQYIQTLFEHTI